MASGVHWESVNDLGQRRRPLATDAFGIYSSLGHTSANQFDIMEPIGKGAMGQVYKARDRKLNRSVAIKALPAWDRGNAAKRARFLKEARAASALNHPHIVTVYDIVEHGGTDLIVMELIDGRTLAEEIPPRGMPVARAIHFARQMAEALKVAHEAGILHRDLKPANVMITTQEHVKLLDFGLAEHGPSLPLETSAPAQQSGTRAFMAPEQLEGRRGDIRSEIFSFGLVLYQMLTGRHAFREQTEERLATAMRTRAYTPLPTKVPAAVSRIVSHCLERTPGNRYGSMREVLTDLTVCADHTVWRGVKTRSQAKGPAPPASVRQVRQLLRRLDFGNPGATRAALTELRWMVRQPSSTAIRERTIDGLKDFLRTLTHFETADSLRVRELRKPTFDVIRMAAEGHLNAHFVANELETTDLFEIDFASCTLPSFSFRKCFLVSSTFEGSTLPRASFEESAIRNVNFRNADMPGADFTDADWFNALHLTESQLISVAPGTLLPCPADVQQLHRYLANRYVFPFDSWPLRVQQELLEAWQEYLRPGGLRDFVAHLTR